jgi:hypothetical protein
MADPKQVSPRGSKGAAAPEFLETFPDTPEGKRDRAAFLKWVEIQQKADAEYERWIKRHLAKLEDDVIALERQLAGRQRELKRMQKRERDARRNHAHQDEIRFIEWQVRRQEMAVDVLQIAVAQQDEQAESAAKNKSAGPAPIKKSSAKRSKPDAG